MPEPALHYPGRKTGLAKKIIKTFPTHRSYIEPFCGTAAVLMAKPRTKLEVINDIDDGIVSFYRAIQDFKTMQMLIDRLNITIHSRTEWWHCKKTWRYEKDPIEKAAKWYYMMMYSVGSLGRNFGRNLKNNTLGGKIQRFLPKFIAVQQRLRNVTVECIDWTKCMNDYDQHNAVFYLDPPYIYTDQGAYEHSKIDHVRLCNRIFRMEAFVALSGYPNSLYDDPKYNWDERHVWPAKSNAIQSLMEINLEEGNARKAQNEILWVKYAN